MPLLRMKVGRDKGEIKDFKFAEAQVLLKRKWAVLVSEENDPEEEKLEGESGSANPK